jgi:uncharacterized protein (TIGR02246 family)
MTRIHVSDETAIHALWQEYAASATAGDLDRWIALWSEEGIQLAPDAARRMGREVIRGEMKPLFDLFDTEMAVYPDEIQVLGEQAYTHGTYEFVTRPKEGGDSTKVKGKFLTILRKEAGDSWKILIDCFNDDAPS